jgi:hypothetical protein
MLLPGSAQPGKNESHAEAQKEKIAQRSEEKGYGEEARSTRWACTVPAVRDEPPYRSDESPAKTRRKSAIESPNGKSAETDVAKSCRVRSSGMTYCFAPTKLVDL